MFSRHADMRAAPVRHHGFVKLATALEQIAIRRRERPVQLVVARHYRPHAAVFDAHFKGWALE